VADAFPPPNAHERNTFRAPSRRRRRRYLSVVQIMLVGAIAYGGAALLNARSLQRMAERLPFGGRRDVAVHVADAAGDVSAALALDRPARVIEGIRHNTRAQPAPVVAAPIATTTAPPPPTTAPRPTTSTAPDALRAGASMAATAAPVTAATTVPPPPTTAPAPTTTTIPPLRTPTDGQPLKIWVGGDSIAEGLGSSMEKLAGQTATLRATSQARISTGLTRPDYFDWPTAVHDVVAQQQPDVLVVVFGTNDPQPIQTATGTYSFGTPEWDTEYRARVDAVMGAATSARKLVWVGLPVVRRENLEPKLEVLDQIFEQEAAKFPDVSYVDTRAMFSPDGAYDAYLVAPDGTPVLVRAADGVHFSLTGYDMLAQAVIDRIGALTQSG
jgi:hypothetical protein